MPEKPEVITVVESLKTKILGRRITDCNVYWDNIIAYPVSNEFKNKIIG
jgi:formamidopyrimidine-DNA glycosylase